MTRAPLQRHRSRARRGTAADCNCMPGIVCTNCNRCERHCRCPFDLRDLVVEDDNDTVIETTAIIPCRRVGESAGRCTIWIAKETPVSARIHYFCPSCKTTLDSPIADAGRNMNCPTRGQRLQIPLPDRKKTVLAPCLRVEQAETTTGPAPVAAIGLRRRRRWTRSKIPAASMTPPKSLCPRPRWSRRR